MSVCIEADSSQRPQRGQIDLRAEKVKRALGSHLDLVVGPWLDEA